MSEPFKILCVLGKQCSALKLRKSYFPKKFAYLFDSVMMFQILHKIKNKEYYVHVMTVSLI